MDSNKQYIELTGSNKQYLEVVENAFQNNELAKYGHLMMQYQCAMLEVKTKLDVDFNDSEIIVRVLKQPSCGNVQINGNTIDFDIEKELGIEVVGDTKVKIMVEDDEDKWEVFDDNVTDEKISDYNTDFYYQPRDYIAACYKKGEVL